MTIINQNKKDFKKWLENQAETESAMAGDPCHCWLALWFESQGTYIWGVFPEHYLERCSDAPGGASQEILLDEPRKDKDGEWIIDEADRIPLEEWASDFSRKVDTVYRNSFVIRDQALAVLTALIE